MVREIRMPTRFTKPSPINYSWIELLPMMIILLFVVLFVGFFPTFDYNPHVVRNEQIDNILNNFALQEP